MIRAGEPTVMWLWVDDACGLCFPETMAATEAYSHREAERILGKRRMAGMGSTRLVRVTIEPLNDEEAADERKRYADWKANRDAHRDTQSAATNHPQGAANEQR